MRRETEIEKEEEKIEKNSLKEKKLYIPELSLKALKFPPRIKVQIQTSSLASFRITLKKTC